MIVNRVAKKQPLEGVLVERCQRRIWDLRSISDVGLCVTKNSILDAVEVLDPLQGVL